MKVISYEDIVNLNISPRYCYQWVSEMIVGKENTILPPKISMKVCEGGFCNVMPSVVKYDEGQKGGVKVVTRYPDRKPSLDSKIFLFDSENGNFLALMDGNWITAMRTGAVAAHSILLLGKSDFKNIGIIGLGNTARATLLVLSEMMPDAEFEIKLFRYKGQEKSFADRFVNRTNLKFSFVDTYEEVVKGSDVVISAVTYLEDDICSDESFEEGVLVVPIHTRGFTNCDLFFDRVFADDYGHVCHFKNFNKFKSFAEVSDVVNGKTAGRENDKERIIAYNIGVSMHDINFATHIYEMACKKRLSEINLLEPTEKFWI